MSTQAGPPPAGEPPAAGRPAPYPGQVTSGGGVTVNTRGVAVTGALRRRGRPAIRPRLRDRPAGIAQLPAAAFPEGVG